MEIRNGILCLINSWRLKIDKVKLKTMIMDQFRSEDLWSALNLLAEKVDMRDAYKKRQD